MRKGAKSYKNVEHTCGRKLLSIRMWRALANGAMCLEGNEVSASWEPLPEKEVGGDGGGGR